MLMMLAIGAGITNMLPWAGPLGRAAAVTGIDVPALWQPLIPIQVIGVALLMVLAVALGLREQSRIRAAGGPAPVTGVEAGVISATPEEAALERRTLMPVNGLLFLSVLAGLVAGLLPPALIFMIGLSLVLLINYPQVEAQMERIRAHAPSALLMGAIILSAGTFASPFSPALWLALGLARADIGAHLRYSFLWMWGFSLVVLGVAMGLRLF